MFNTTPAQRALLHAGESALRSAALLQLAEQAAAAVGKKLV